MPTKFYSKSLKDREHLDHVDIYIGKLHKTYLNEIGWVVLYCIHLVQDRNQRWVLVHMKRNFRFYKSRKIS